MLPPANLAPSAVYGATYDLQRGLARHRMGIDWNEHNDDHQTGWMARVSPCRLLRTGLTTVSA